MAIGKKRRAKTTGTSRRRKSGAKKRKTKVSGASETVTIGAKRFTRSSCHTTKSAAQSQAEKVRDSGKTARVIKSGTHHCVYTGSKRRRA